MFAVLLLLTVIVLTPELYAHQHPKCYTFKNLCDPKKFSNSKFRNDHCQAECIVEDFRFGKCDDNSRLCCCSDKQTEGHTSHSGKSSLHEKTQGYATGNLQITKLGKAENVRHRNSETSSEKSSISSNPSRTSVRSDSAQSLAAVRHGTSSQTVPSRQSSIISSHPSSDTSSKTATELYARQDPKCYTFENLCDPKKFSNSKFRNDHCQAECIVENFRFGTCDDGSRLCCCSDKQTEGHTSHSRQSSLHEKTHGYAIGNSQIAKTGKAENVRHRNSETSSEESSIPFNPSRTSVRSDSAQSLAGVRHGTSSQTRPEESSLDLSYNPSRTSVHSDSAQSLAGIRHRTSPQTVPSRQSSIISSHPSSDTSSRTAVDTDSVYSRETKSHGKTLISPSRPASISADTSRSSIPSDPYRSSIPSDPYRSSISSDPYQPSIPSGTSRSSISSDSSRSSIPSDPYRSSIPSNPYRSSTSSDPYQPSIPSGTSRSSVYSDSSQSSQKNSFDLKSGPRNPSKEMKTEYYTNSDVHQSKRPSSQYSSSSDSRPTSISMEGTSMNDVSHSDNSARPRNSGTPSRHSSISSINSLRENQNDNRFSGQRTAHMSGTKKKSEHAEITHDWTCTEENICKSREGTLESDEMILPFKYKKCNRFCKKEGYRSGKCEDFKCCCSKTSDAGDKHEKASKKQEKAYKKQKKANEKQQSRKKSNAAK